MVGGRLLDFREARSVMASLNSGGKQRRPEHFRDFSGLRGGGRMPGQQVEASERRLVVKRRQGAAQCFLYGAHKLFCAIRMASNILLK